MHEEFKNLIGNHPILGTQVKEKSHIDFGIIEAINLESQMMNVSIPFKNNIIIKDIPINNPVSVTGAGIRFMPTKGMVALVHFDQTMPNSYFHIGYYSGDMSIFTNSTTGDKNQDKQTMRCLSAGEMALSNNSGSELFLSEENIIVLKNGDGFYFIINEDIAQGLFNDLNFVFNDAVLNIGRIKRVTRDYGTLPKDIADVNPKILRTNTGSPLNEFSFSVGENYNTLGIPDVLKNTVFDFNTSPYVGVLTLANQVFDEIGTAVTSLKTLTSDDDILKFMLKMGTGIKIGIDSLGSLYIVNEYTDSHIKFGIGATKSGSTVTDETSFEITMDNASVLVNKDKIRIGNTSDGDTYNTITLDSDGTIISDNNSNTIKMNSDGMVIADNNNNVINLTQTGIAITDDNNNIVNLTPSGITITDDNDNTFTLTEGGISVVDSNSNKINLTSDGVTITDVNNNIITLSNTGFDIKDLSGNEIVSSLTSIKINGNLEVLK